MTEQHIVQNEEYQKRGKEHAEVLIYYDNIDTVEKQNILEKIVELMKKDNFPNLRRIDRVTLKEKTKLVDEVIESVQTSNITEDNKLVKCGILLITQLLGIKEIKNKKKEELFWKRRIESNKNVLRKDVRVTERWETGMLEKESQKARLDHLHQVERKGYKKLWSGIWEKNVKHNECADWIQKVAEEMQGSKQHNIEITPTKIKERISEMAKWKAPGLDAVHGY